MSLFLRFASIKCPRRKVFCVKRFYWTIHDFTFREGLGIRYFIPRTADNADDIKPERMKDRDSIPEEFKLIYSFSDENTFSLVSYTALGFAAVFIYFLFNPKYLMGLDENKKKEENEPISEEAILQDDYTSGGTIEKIETMLDSALDNEAFGSGDTRLKSAVGLSMIILFLYVRSRCVLKIYRHNNDFITVFHQALGFGKKLIKHRANDCCYYPKRKWFNYNLLGKTVIIFSDLFVSFEERQLYIRSQ